MHAWIQRIHALVARNGGARLARRTSSRTRLLTSRPARAAMVGPTCAVRACLVADQRVAQAARRLYARRRRLVSAEGCDL